jgi:hypothetical protein
MTKLDAQKIALIHKEFKQPIIYTDSVSVQQITSGYFALEVSAVDSFYAGLKYLKEMLSVRQRAKMQSFQFRSGNTIIHVDRVPFAYGDRYNITVKTKVNEVTSVFDIASKDASNSKNAKRIGNLMDHITQNKSLFKAPNEIHPKFYEVVVITD